jgi:hypothetical protein
MTKLFALPWTLHGRPSTTPKRSLPFLCFLFYCAYAPAANATIYVGNETYVSLPGLFGQFMREGRRYDARLQFSRGVDPYLCDPSLTALNRSLFAPQPITMKKPHSNYTLALPVASALLAPRGKCSFQRKAMVAELLDPTNEFLIVYNINADGEDALVPMYSEYGNTRLVLLSVTHRTGIALKEWIAAQTPTIIQQGGPWLQLDADPPDGMATLQDLQNMLLSALGFLLLMIALSACLLVCAGTVGTASHVVVWTGPRHRSVLTEEEVRLVSRQVMADSVPTFSVAHASSLEVMGREYDSSCAVCIEELSSPHHHHNNNHTNNDNDDHSDDTHDSTITLPCHHRFHADCILPWLTERQAKCPLCKYDVMAYVMSSLSSSSTTTTTSPEIVERTRAAPVSMLHRVMRYRWTQVHPHWEDGLVLDVSDDASHELELTTQQS